MPPARQRGIGGNTLRLVLAIWLNYLMMEGSGLASAASPPPKILVKAPSPKAYPRPPAPKPKISMAPPPLKSNATCQDRSAQCRNFAAMGYCSSHPVYMVGTPKAPGNCLASCKKCPIGSCHDASPQCGQFASLGYCESRPVYMMGTDKQLGMCLASCKACLTAAPPPPSPLVASAFFIPPSSGNATLVSMASKKLCVAPHPVGGRLLITAKCDGSVQQLWTWNKATRTLVNAASGLCITYNANLADGSPVNLQACTKPATSKLQQWDYVPYTFGVLTPLADKAWGLHINSTAAGAQLTMWRVPKATDGLGAALFSLFGLLPAKCMDLRPDCSALVKQGRCNTDVTYMVGDATHYGACQASCGKCPIFPPAPPPPKPFPPGNRPPRGGGAQGGPCVAECPDGYEYATVLLDPITYASTNITGQLCVRYESIAATNCELCAFGSSSAKCSSCGYLICCDQCPTGYISDHRDDEFVWGVLGVGTNCNRADYYTLCAAPAPPLQPPALSPPPPPPDSACSSVVGEDSFDHWCCELYGAPCYFVPW